MQPRTGSRAGFNISLDHARAAKAKLRRALGKSVDVVGIGVTGREGRYALKVNVRRMPKGRILPSEIDGVPVKFEVVGAIRRGSSTDRIRSVRMRMQNPPHPGVLVREECLVPLGLTITFAARALGVTRKALSELVNGHSGISPEMAIRLSKAFGSEPETWLGMQMEYDLWHAMRQSSRLRIKRLSLRPVAGNRLLGKTLRSGSLFGAHPGSVRIKRGVDLVTVNPVLDE